MFGALVAVGTRFESRLNENVAEDHVRDVAISKLTQHSEFIGSRWQAVEAALHEAQKNQADLLVLVNEVRLKIATNDEVTRNIRDRIEALAAYMRSNGQIKESGIQHPQGSTRYDNSNTVDAIDPHRSNLQRYNP